MEFFDWLGRYPLGVAFFGLGAGGVMGLYIVGITHMDGEDERVQELLDETQQVPHMPSFDDPDEGLAWHMEQAKRYEKIKREKLDQRALMEILEATVNEVERLKKIVEGDIHETVIDGADGDADDGVIVANGSDGAGG